MRFTVAPVILSPAILLLLCGPAISQEKKPAPPAAVSQPTEPAPRGPDGHVLLGSSPGKNGYWEVRPGLGGVPRPDTVPFQPWARAVYQYRQSTNGKDSPLVACKAAVGPAFFNAPGFDFADVPEQKSIFILNIAGPHSWRVIHMDGRAHPTGENVRPTFLGDSVGHWEGDTLVIDTVGLNEKQWPVGSYPTTDRLHLTERISRPNLRTLTYEATIDDPGAYTMPWTVRWTINEKTASSWIAGGDIFEYICEDAGR
ncbi:MAG TPA: hypothetical protein VGF16_11340 [Bryobacteraceae bacterium]|jgi:hypothetical protein